MSASGKADMAWCTAHVRFRGQSGHDLLTLHSLLLMKADIGLITAVILPT